MDVKWEGFLPIEGYVIVIEDDPTLRALMEEIIAEIGAETVSFESADEGLTHLLQTAEQCCLVIVDHGVPGQVKGTEFIEMVTSRWPTIAAILTSGYLIEADAIPGGAIYLHKPWSLDDLIIAIATLLQPGTPIQKG